MNVPAEPLRTELFYEGGVKEFVKYLDRSKDRVDGRTYLCARRTRDDIGVEVAMWWNDSYNENGAAIYQQHPAA